MTVRIRMLGNAFQYTYGEEFDVQEDEAMRLVGMGYAVLVEEEMYKEETDAV